MTEDRLLGGRVILRQPAAGLRATIDPVFLASAVPACAGERVLDLGSGTGVASLCLARRVDGCTVQGLELQPALVELACQNAALNDLEARVTALRGDLRTPPAELPLGGFDHVMANPPYLPAGTGTLSPTEAKSIAIGEGAVGMTHWIDTAFAMVRRRGFVTFVHRADRLAELVAGFARHAGAIVVHPLWAGVGKPAHRLIIRGRRGARTPLKLLPGMVLHDADGRFTAAAEEILREGAALIL